MFDVKVRAVNVVERDQSLPKYQRLGMERNAWFLQVSLSALCECWAACKGLYTPPIRGGRGRCSSRRRLRSLLANFAAFSSCSLALGRT